MKPCPVPAKTLQIKEMNSTLPVVLITKNYKENLMDEAIGLAGSAIILSLGQPLNQVLLSLKKIIDTNGWRPKPPGLLSRVPQSVPRTLQQQPRFMSGWNFPPQTAYWELGDEEKRDSPRWQEVVPDTEGPRQPSSFKFISKNYASG